jgi:hypothetical protein
MEKLNKIDRFIKFWIALEVLVNDEKAMMFKELKIPLRQSILR